jgi:hypothetical protein
MAEGTAEATERPKVFFDITVGGEDAGHIVMEVMFLFF